MSVDSFIHKLLHQYANFIMRFPRMVMLCMVILTLISAFLIPSLKLNTNQIHLLPPDIAEVKAVRRLIDSHGGSGDLTIALLSEEFEGRLNEVKKIIDELAEEMGRDQKHVRHVLVRHPVEFIREHMFLLLPTPALKEFSEKVIEKIKNVVHKNSPLHLDLEEEPEEDFSDIEKWIRNYSHVGKKDIQDPYLISEDKKMMLILIKPKWDTNDLGKTRDFIEQLRKVMDHYSTTNHYGYTLKENYTNLGTGKMIHYGFSGAYKSALDNSYSLVTSLEPVGTWAFLGIFIVVWTTFRGRLFATFLVLIGMMMGTILTMGFCAITLREINLITSVLSAILMGFGVDYGIHFVSRFQVELEKHPPEKAIYETLVGAGRPAFISCVVTAGAFYVLLLARFRGFSHFGFLAGSGTFILAITLFSLCAVVCLLLARNAPHYLYRWFPKPPEHQQHFNTTQWKKFFTSYRWFLPFIAYMPVFVGVAFAIPWNGKQPFCDAPLETQSLWHKIQCGARFNYQSKALSSSKENSYILQKEIEEKFNLNADPVVAISPDLNAAQALYTGIQEHPDQYDTFDTLVSIYSFMPTAQRAHDNVEILEHFNAQLEKMHFSWDMLPEQFKKEQSWLEKAVHAKPYDIDKLPLEILQYFQTLPEAQPENRGFLTYIYPRVDLGNGKSLWRFADQATHIKTSAGNIIQAAGLPLLYARLAHMVIQDGLLTVFIASIWVFLMHLLDFRSPFLALISVLPLGIGLCMMLGVLNIIGSSLNFMNIVMLPILLGFGISHGLYILHRFLDGMPVYALMRSVGVAVFSSTSTAIAGFAALFASHHQGLRSMGLLACVGLSTTLWVSFTVLIGCLLWMEKKSKTPEI